MEKFLHAFNMVSGMGYGTLEKIWRYFGSWEKAWEAAKHEDYLKAGLTQEMATKILKARDHIEVDKEYQKLWEKDMVLIHRHSKEYPQSFKTIPAPPFLLYRKGAPLLQNNHYVSIVGTRMPSSYGEKMALKISEGVALGGGVVVSGLAFGIDAVAHFGAVKNNKPTVAVLASGVDTITPASHNSLARKILETDGTILSEYAGDTSAYKMRFLERNRIISGLSKATIVIEAKEKSGALITAKHAAEQNREVYALVGDLTRPQAQGCLKLIRDGNGLAIVNVEDLLSSLGFETQNIYTISFSKEERLIMDFLVQKPRSTENLLEKAKLPLSTVNILLTQLELKGTIKKNKAFLWEPL